MKWVLLTLPQECRSVSYSSWRSPSVLVFSMPCLCWPSECDILPGVTYDTHVSGARTALQVSARLRTWDLDLFGSFVPIFPHSPHVLFSFLTFTRFLLTVWTFSQASGSLARFTSSDLSTSSFASAKFHFSLFSSALFHIPWYLYSEQLYISPALMYCIPQFGYWISLLLCLVRFPLFCPPLHSVYFPSAFSEIRHWDSGVAQSL